MAYINGKPLAFYPVVNIIGVPKEVIERTVTALTIPKGVKAIGKYAFYRYEKLESVTVPGDLESVGSYAFGSSGLKSIALPEGCIINSGAFESTKIESMDVPSGNTIVDLDTFRYCTQLTRVTIPEGVTFIGSRAFGNCTSLGYIVLPSTVTSIISTAFSGCTKLADIYVPWTEGKVLNAPWGAPSATIHYNANGTARLEYYSGSCIGMGGNNNPIIVIAALHGGNVVKRVRYEAFKNELTLRQVTMPSTLELVETEAFAGCTALTHVTFGTSARLTAIEAQAFSGCTKLAVVWMPKSVDSVGKGAFENCDLLQYVYITDLSAWLNTSFGSISANPVHRGAALFLNGSRLENLSVPADITRIKNYAFRGCQSLKSVTLHTGVTEVGTSAFENCVKVTQVTLPNGLEKLQQYAFSGCPIGHDITIPASVTNIGKQAFSSAATGIKKITFKGKPSGNISTSAFKAPNIANIYVPWAEGEVANAPWGAANATIHYNSEV